MRATGRLVAPLLFALVAAATVAVLLGTQGVRGQLLVDQIELTNEFRPARGEHAAIRFRLTENEAAATVEVIDADDGTVSVLAEDVPLGDFEIHGFRWRGRGSTPGHYRVLLTLSSLDREIVLPERIELKRGRDG